MQIVKPRDDMDWFLCDHGFDCGLRQAGEQVTDLGDIADLTSSHSFRPMSWFYRGHGLSLRISPTIGIKT
ncbi:hypothetical protein RRG08_066553 [Elysia crispata]|uniref:Uncharacterized protein n=1 Tax=Elysia crispata TaxID=231223 RepID=A0AAE1CZ56_9GAST|nr:hypothetical protein RRG08_066553 [Elysia crispata]